MRISDWSSDVCSSDLVGLPFDHQIAMPIMGGIALLYAVAIVSGVICLLPSLVKDLFALRFGKNLKRMWLDLHNVLGLFSLPFHLIMALTSVEIGRASCRERGCQSVKLSGVAVY